MTNKQFKARKELYIKAKAEDNPNRVILRGGNLTIRQKRILRAIEKEEA